MFNTAEIWLYTNPSTAAVWVLSRELVSGRPKVLIYGDNVGHGWFTVRLKLD